MNRPGPWLYLLAVLWVWLGGALAAASAPAGPELTPVPAQTLREALRQWQAQKDQVRRLQAELRQLDVLSDPDRDERYWWNPFWRWSKENQAQQATEITLHLQKLELQQQELERRLLPESERFARQALENPDLTPADQELWLVLDAWRLPRLLAEPDWESLAPPGDPQARELFRSRLQAAEALAGHWRELEDYLSACLRKRDPGAQEAQQYREWQKRLQGLRLRLAETQEVLEKK